MRVMAKAAVLKMRDAADEVMNVSDEFGCFRRC